MYKDRIVTEKLRKLAGAFPSVVVTGARQVGKSTLLRHVFPDLETVVFDPVTDVGNARRDPDLFLDNHPAPLFLDEIQYAPELVPAIKRRIDRDPRPMRYLMTGSQQWQVLKSVAESLAGRTVFLNLEGFSVAEIAGQIPESHWLEHWLENPDAFLANAGPRLRIPRTLYETLWRGWLPQADQHNLDLIPSFFQGYLQTYIERDVRIVAEVEDWQQFGRFIQLAAALTAQEVNRSQLGRELGVTNQTAQRWLATLRATFQWYEVPAYHGNTIKRISGKPKGYFADTGLACSLQRVSSPQALAGHPMTGSLFETAVAAEIRKLSSVMATPPNLYHWRSHGGAEVDLLLERDGVLFPMEIKLTSNPGRRHTNGINAFRKTYPHLRIAPGLVVAPCERPQKISEQDYALPWDTA